jgi:hypothetical protein
MTTKHKQPNLAFAAIKGGLIIAVILTPIFFVALVMLGYIEVGNFAFGMTATHYEAEIRCFDESNCILKVRDKWYIVTDVLESEDVPLKFRINPEELVVEDSLSVDPTVETQPQP